MCVCVCVYWRGVSYLGHSVKKSAIKFELKTDRPSRGRSLTLDVLWIGPLGLQIGQAVCYLRAVADSSAPKSARTVIPTAQWERGSGRTGHPPGRGGQCGAGLLCGTHVLPITPFCILPLLIHSKQNYCVYIVYCNILQKYYHKLHCRVYYNIGGKSVVNRNSAHQIHKLSYFLGKWGAGRQKEGDTIQRCLSPACDVYFTH